MNVIYGDILCLDSQFSRRRNRPTKKRERRKKERTECRLVGDDFCDRLELGKKWANERERKRKKINEKQKEARSKVPRAEAKSDVGKDVESWAENQDEKRKGQVVRIARQIADVESERGWQDAKGR